MEKTEQKEEVKEVGKIGETKGTESLDINLGPAHCSHKHLWAARTLFIELFEKLLRWGVAKDYYAEFFRVSTALEARALSITDYLSGGMSQEEFCNQMVEKCRRMRGEIAQMYYDLCQRKDLKKKHKETVQWTMGFLVGHLSQVEQHLLAELSETYPKQGLKSILEESVEHGGRTAGN